MGDYWRQTRLDTIDHNYIDYIYKSCNLYTRLMFCFSWVNTLHDKARVKHMVVISDQHSTHPRFLSITSLLQVLLLDVHHTG